MPSCSAPSWRPGCGWPWTPARSPCTTSRSSRPGAARWSRSRRWPAGNATAKSFRPQQFIPTAERSGLIVEIGTEVLLQACTELRPWLAEDPSRSLAVNVSGVQLQHGDFAELVLAVTESCGVDPRQLVLEVTESVFFDDDCHVIQQLDRAPQGRRAGGAGRLRHRVLVAGPAAGPARGHPEDRPVLHLHDPHRRRRTCRSSAA